jgi:uncharacterized protein (TIGR00369 family)
MRWVLYTTCHLNGLDEGMTMTFPLVPNLYQASIHYFTQCPHAQALGIKVVATDHDRLRMAIDWAEHLVGDTQTMALHGGVLTTLVDTTSATVIMGHLAEPKLLVTLDLRIDYLTHALPHKPIVCEAVCYRLTEQIAFTEAVCFQTEPYRLVAKSLASFMISDLPETIKQGLAL